MKDVSDLIVESIKERALYQQIERAGDYRDEKGILHCGKCNTPREAYIESLEQVMPITCACDQAEIIRQKNAQTIAKYREDCFRTSEQTNATFANDKKYNPKVTQIMQRYVENFETFKKDGSGMLLYGTVGSGKSFHAYQVANALVDKIYRVKVTLFEELYRDIPDKHKNEYFKRLSKYDLVILDDLGAENKSAAMLSFVFSVIDTLYREKTPFIITTNLSLEEIKTTTDEERKRIYTRIIERCPSPICVTGNIRTKIANEKSRDYKTMLGID